MATPTNPIEDSVPVSNPTPQTTGAKPVVPATSPAPQMKAAGGGSDSFSSMSALKAANPELYKLMMQGISTTIINQMRDSQQRLKEIQDKSRRESEAR